MITAAQFLPSTHRVPHPLAHVLLAEDDPGFRDVVGCYLRRAGYRVSRVRDTTALLTRIGRAKPWGPEDAIDIVVSDIYMPGGTGLRVLRGLADAGFVTPVVLMTAFGDPAVHAEAITQGARAVLDKPFDLGMLLRVVDRICFPPS